MKKPVIIASVLLLVASALMFFNTGNGKVHLQPSTINVAPEGRAENPQENPYVIRSDSLGRQTGMEQTDQQTPASPHSQTGIEPNLEMNGSQAQPGEQEPAQDYYELDIEEGQGIGPNTFDVGSSMP